MLLNTLKLLMNLSLQRKDRFNVILYDETYTPRSTKQSRSGWKCRAVGALGTCRKTPTTV